MINYDSSFSNRLLHERPADLVGLAWLESNMIGVNRIGLAQYQGYEGAGSFHNRYRWCRYCNDMHILLYSNTPIIVYVISEESRVLTDKDKIA